MNWNQLLLNPALAFFVVLAAVVLGAWLLKRLECRDVEDVPGKLKPYACGEDTPVPDPQPDYEFFFPFAFMFTIMHVAVLVLATIPSVDAGNILVIALFILVCVAGFVTWFRRRMH